MDEKTITLYEAIKEMRKLTAKGKPFSFSHVTYDRLRQNTHGIREVQNAILRPAAKEDDVENADNKLFYIDKDIHQSRVAWQPLIVSFNGIPVKLT